jgi:hypothetical protein
MILKSEQTSRPVLRVAPSLELIYALHDGAVPAPKAARLF